VITVAKVALAAPALLVVVLGVEIAIAANREYLPNDPGYRIDATATPEDVAPDAEPIRLAVLGDSTVAGVGSPTAAQALPTLIAERVADATGRPVEVMAYGVSGARTESVRTQQLPLLDPTGLDAVVIVIGSNDVTHATPWYRFDDQTVALLRAAHERTGAPVVLGGIPQFRTVPALAQPLRALVGLYAVPLRGAQRRAAARVDSATFVDIAALASPRFVGRPASMSADGFHPAPLGYGFWADAIAPAVVAEVS
jgi:lysophospholipase L1-like esterase